MSKVLPVQQGHLQSIQRGKHDGAALYAYGQKEERDRIARVSIFHLLGKGKKYVSTTVTKPFLLQVQSRGNLGMRVSLMLERNVDGLADFVAALDVQERLNPQQAMFGGRCNGTRLHFRSEDGEKIHYVDFTSLYSSVLRDERCPVDHPEIITGDFKPLDQYFGLAYVKILPPARLYHPVLPFRVNNKLYFPLCRTCATSNSGPGCECSDDDRALIGTWCMPELMKAVEMGYRIMKMYEVYHFLETTKYDPRTGTI